MSKFSQELYDTASLRKLTPAWKENNLSLESKEELMSELLSIYQLNVDLGMRCYKRQDNKPENSVVHQLTA